MTSNDSPITDIPFFIGASFWAAQKVFRVFYIKNFAEWKPHVWNSIKADYGFHSDEEEDGDDLVDFSRMPSPGLIGSSATKHFYKYKCQRWC